MPSAMPKEVVFLQGHLAQPLIERGIRVDLLMANLPYIPSGELAQLAVADFEPRPGAGWRRRDGLDCIRGLLRQAGAVCRAGAHVLLEIGAGQGDAVKQLVWRHCGAQATILRDYAGLERIARFNLLGPLPRRLP